MRQGNPDEQGPQRPLQVVWHGACGVLLDPSTRQKHPGALPVEAQRGGSPADPQWKQLSSVTQTHMHV